MIARLTLPVSVLTCPDCHRTVGLLESRMFEPWQPRTTSRTCGCAGRTWPTVDTIEDLFGLPQMEIAEGVWLSGAVWWKPWTRGVGRWVSTDYLAACETFRAALREALP